MYFDFINSLALEKKRIYILGINLPSIFKKRNAVVYTNQVINQNITDENLVKLFKKDLSKYLPNIYERTNRSILFNNILKEYSQRYGIAYDDFTEETLNQKTGRLNKNFHLPKDNDPHFRDTSRTRNLYANKLISINLESEKSATVKLCSQLKQSESQSIKLKQWQSRLDELRNKLQQIQENSDSIQAGLTHNRYL